MTVADPDLLDRTLKLELDSGRASSREEAEAIVRRYKVQMDVGVGIEQSLTRQAVLLTALNTARRAFPGGVRVRTHDDPALTSPWVKGASLRDAIGSYGGECVDALADDVITIVIGDPPVASADRVLHTTTDGWSGGVVQRRTDCLSGDADFALSGMLAGALAVSEAFQAVRGDDLAARRDVGLSLWRPEADWRSPEGRGDGWAYLPAAVWLLGLGHLGQAIAWGVGLLPYAEPSEVLAFLEDTETVVPANAATGLLVPVAFEPTLKTRLVSSRLEKLGMRTRVVERLFTERTRREPEEPGVALCGFDQPESRRALEGAGFDLTIDLGLGGGPAHYLDLIMHSFPSGLRPSSAFSVSKRTSHVELLALPAYQSWADDLGRQGGLSADEIRCGLLEVADRTVGAAFVGAVAGCIGLAEAIRALMGGPRYEVVSLSLRSPSYVDAAVNTDPGAPRNPGYARAIGA